MFLVERQKCCHNLFTKIGFLWVSCSLKFSEIMDCFFWRPKSRWIVFRKKAEKQKNPFEIFFKRIHFAGLDVLSDIDLKRHHGLNAFLGLHPFYPLQHFIIFLPQFLFYESFFGLGKRQIG